MYRYHAILPVKASRTDSSGQSKPDSLPIQFFSRRQAWYQSILPVNAAWTRFLRAIKTGFAANQFTLEGKSLCQPILEATSSPEPPKLTAPGEPAAAAGETALTPERVMPAALEAASAPEPLKLTARGEVATAAAETAAIPEPARPAALEAASTPEPPELPASGEPAVAAGETATTPEPPRPGLHSRAAVAHCPRQAGQNRRGLQPWRWPPLQSRRNSLPQASWPLQPGRRRDLRRE